MSNQLVLVVGAGPAGVAAAVQCKRSGLEPLLMDRTGQGGGLVSCAFSIENYPGLGPTSGEDFSGLIRQHARRFDLTVKEGTVAAIEPAGGNFLLRGNFGQLVARSVILAVGTVPGRLEIPGAEYVDYTPLFPPVGDCLVIGGGDAAFDYALSLSRVGAQVTILVRGERLRANRRLVDLVAARGSIEVLTGALMRAVEASGDRLLVDYSRNDRPRQKTVDKVIAAVGRSSALPDLLSGIDPDLDGIASRRYPGLYVVGDARSGVLGQIGMAVGDGLAAAMAVVKRSDSKG